MNLIAKAALNAGLLVTMGLAAHAQTAPVAGEVEEGSLAGKTLTFVSYGGIYQDGQIASLEDWVSHPGQPVGSGRQALLVRPEKISLRRPGAGTEDGLNRLPGRISEAIYLGSGVKYEVTLADGSRAVARVPLTDEPLALGESVVVGWQKQDARLLPDDGSSQAAQSGEEQ